MPSQGKIEATTEAAAKLKSELQNNPAFRQELSDDPKAALAKIGITVDDQMAQAIKSQLAAGGPQVASGIITVTAIV